MAGSGDTVPPRSLRPSLDRHGTRQGRSCSWIEVATATGAEEHGHDPASTSSLSSSAWRSSSRSPRRPYRLSPRRGAHRPAPAPALRTMPAPKTRLATASAAAPAGTLRATTTMRAALRTEATNTHGERAGERARAAALRAQLDELNAELAKVNTEAERALTRERMRADRLGDRIAALQRDLDAARVDVVVAQRRADTAETDRRAALTRLEQAEVARDRAEQGKDGERVRANALRDRIGSGGTRRSAAEARPLGAAQDGVAGRMRSAWGGPAEVPARIGPVEFGELGAMIAVRCPSDYAPVMRKANGLWEPGAGRVDRATAHRPRAAHPATDDGHAVPTSRYHPGQ